jgi:hypothetical protein
LGKPLEKRTVGRSIGRESNIKVDHREMGCEGGNPMELGGGI